MRVGSGEVVGRAADARAEYGGLAGGLYHGTTHGHAARLLLELFIEPPTAQALRKSVRVKSHALALSAPKLKSAIPVL